MSDRARVWYELGIRTSQALYLPRNIERHGFLIPETIETVLIENLQIAIHNASEGLAFGIEHPVSVRINRMIQEVMSFWDERPPVPTWGFRGKLLDKLDLVQSQLNYRVKRTVEETAWWTLGLEIVNGVGEIPLVDDFEDLEGSPASWELDNHVVANNLCEQLSSSVDQLIGKYESLSEKDFRRYPGLPIELWGWLAIENQLAVQFSPPQKIESIKFSLMESTVVLNGTCYKCEREGILLLQALFEAKGSPLGPDPIVEKVPELATKIGHLERVIQKLPDRLKALIVRKPGSGTRFKMEELD